jgi:hypothetical protein
MSQQVLHAYTKTSDGKIHDEAVIELPDDWNGDYGAGIVDRSQLDQRRREIEGH